MTGTMCQAELDGVAVIALPEPGETRAMTQARAWEIARTIRDNTRVAADGRGTLFFDREACESEARRRVLSAYLGCSYDISLWNR